MILIVHNESPLYKHTIDFQCTYAFSPTVYQLSVYSYKLNVAENELLDVNSHFSISLSFMITHYYIYLSSSVVGVNR